jgi:hypothetical protein
LLLKASTPVELIPLKPEQHQVVLVPKATTDLPFFYHTKKKSLLARNIDYQGMDAYGRPIHWKTIPNRDPEIGEPSIDAHDVWMKLVKPIIDLRLNLYDESSYVIPLGGCRESLRIVGWGEGGFQARRLFRALNQIGNTNIVADMWIPTTELDEHGAPLFQPIKASFTKMSIYAIGSTHLTAKQLQEGRFDFDFDLNDTVYIQLHPIEAQIQKSQPQRYIDNQYLFSVKPVAQRWYELMAARIYGVIKHRGEYCEIRYSWYVQHHHTLKRHYTRKRATQQIGEVVADHVRFGYITKFELITAKEPGQEIDWVIRFYPGQAAKDSVARILNYISKKNPRQRKLTVVKSVEPKTEPTHIFLTPEQQIDERLVAELTNRGVTPTQAAKIVAGLDLGPDEYLTDILDWADYLIGQAPAGKIYNPSGFYVHLIKERVFPPATFETSRKRRLRHEAQQVIAQRLQEQARITLAYDDYLTGEIDAYIAKNPEQFKEALDARRQHLKAHKALGLWSDESITKMAAPAARSEIRKRTVTLTLEAFAARYKAQELAARLTVLLLPAPRLNEPSPSQPGQGSEAQANSADEYFTV